MRAIFLALLLALAAPARAGVTIDAGAEYGLGSFDTVRVSQDLVHSYLLSFGSVDCAVTDTFQSRFLGARVAAEARGFVFGMGFRYFDLGGLGVKVSASQTQGFDTYYLDVRQQDSHEQSLVYAFGGLNRRFFDWLSGALEVELGQGLMLLHETGSTRVYDSLGFYTPPTAATDLRASGWAPWYGAALELKLSPLSFLSLDTKVGLRQQRYEAFTINQVTQDAAAYANYPWVQLQNKGQQLAWYNGEPHKLNLDGFFWTVSLNYRFSLGGGALAPAPASPPQTQAAPVDPGALISEVERDLGRGDNARVIDKLLAYPGRAKNPTLLQFLGVAQYRSAQYPQALEAFKAAAALDPGNAEIQNWMRATRLKIEGPGASAR